MISKLSTNNSRFLSVDCLRGLVMVVMALDHVREYWHKTSLSTTDVAHTTFVLFMTRWITNFCAPVFIFLAGLGASLSLIRGKTKKQLSKYLIIRGFILILLELSYLSKIISIPIKLQMPIPSTIIILEVIWVLGWSMIILAGLIWLPDYLIFIFGAVTVVGHNALDSIKVTGPMSLNFFWSILHAQNFIPLSPKIVVLISYPLIPWVGVMALGYLCGKIFSHEQAQRSRLLIRLGIIMTVIFIVLRAVNIYGDPQPWAVQKSGIFTILSFLNCQKYPPSLLFLLMTLGPSIIVLGLLERRIPQILNPIILFGRVPLFYFLVHLPYICILLLLSGLARFGLSEGNILASAQVPHLYMVYSVWVVVMLSMYPICRWYARIKREKTWIWLKYI